MPESEAEVVERDPVSGLDLDSHTVDTFMYTPLLPPVGEHIIFTVSIEYLFVQPGGQRGGRIPSASNH